MTVADVCANCKAPLPEDQSADNRYCATCAAAWTGGNDAGATTAERCANCAAPLPADQPADNRYCATCTASWTRGKASR